MHGLFRSSALAIALTAAAFHGGALAINGAHLGGNGIKNAAMGGASIALPLDAVAAANNPAGMAFVPSSVTLGLQVFHGDSSAQYVLPGNHLENSQTTPAPEGGFNWHLSPDLTVGFSVAGSGVGSDYGQPALPVPGAGTAKTTLRIAEIVPTRRVEAACRSGARRGSQPCARGVRSGWRDRAGASGRVRADSGSRPADGHRRRLAGGPAVEAHH